MAGYSLFKGRKILMSKRYLLEYCNCEKLEEGENGGRKFENLDPSFDEVFETWRGETSKLESNQYFLGVVPTFGEYILFPSYFGEYSFPLTKVVRGEGIRSAIEKIIENNVGVDLDKNSLKDLRKISNDKYFLRENITDAVLLAELENCPEDFNPKYTKIAFNESAENYNFRAKPLRRLAPIKYK